MKMRTIHAAICLLAAASIFLTACGEGDPVQTTSGTTAATTPVQTTTAPADSEGANPDTTPAVGEKTVSIVCGSKSASGDGSAELSLNSRNFREGEVITVTLPEGQHYVAFCLSKGNLEESILYVSGNEFSYTIPNVSYTYPAAMANNTTVTARIPDESELTASHNLALNPADLIDPAMKINGSYKAYWDGNVYPHATTSSVHNFADGGKDKYDFEARNAIDGFTKNNGHGQNGLQSWGPAADFNTRSGFITIDFGHEVKADTLNIYIRADFPHDTYFTSAEIVFSDGSTETITLTNSAKAQTFDLGGKTTSSIKLTKMSKQDASGWAALMEIEVMGSEIVG